MKTLKKQLSRFFKVGILPCSFASGYFLSVGMLSNDVIVFAEGVFWFFVGWWLCPLISEKLKV